MQKIIFIGVRLDDPIIMRWNKWKLYQTWQGDIEKIGPSGTLTGIGIKVEKYSTEYREEYAPGV